MPPAVSQRSRSDLQATPEQSEKTERLVRDFATALHVWDARSHAQAFLNTAHALLDGRSPLDMATTDTGARRVGQLLWELFYGRPA